jgi:hypothetical protein
MITIYDWFGYELPIKERYRLIKKAGFESSDSNREAADFICDSNNNGVEKYLDKVNKAGA